MKTMNKAAKAFLPAYFAVLIAFTCGTSAAASTQPAPNWKYFEEQVLLSTTIIGVPAAAKAGTGFIVRVDSKKHHDRAYFFIVSNAHVFNPINPSAMQLESPIITRFHTINADAKAPDINSPGIAVAFQNGVDPYFRHPNTEIDLGCLLIKSHKGIQPNAVRAVSLDLMSDFSSENLIPGIGVWFAGYPAGHYDEVHNLPILRRGTVGSYPRIDFNNQPIFIIDAPVHYGSSGSPVFSEVPGENVKLLGIVSQKFKDYRNVVTVTPQGTTQQQKLVEVPGLGSEQDLGLGLVIKAPVLRSFIEDLVTKLEKDQKPIVAN